MDDRELRRAYHDRMAQIRSLSMQVVEYAVVTLEEAVDALSGDDGGLAGELRSRPGEAAAVVASVDSEVVSVLALESPMAGDLRLILAARDVSQVGLLCVGLAVAVAKRASGARSVLDESARRLAGDMGRATANLLAQAQLAWTALDEPAAQGVRSSAAGVRDLQREFFARLLSLRSTPMDVSLDLGTMLRAFERLADHAFEISERVLFVTSGRAATADPT